MPSRCFRPACLVQLACVLLLAWAQHTALVHAVWHAGAGARAAAADAHAHRAAGGDRHENDGEDAHRTLCVFHAAMGQVLGVGDAPAAGLALCAACVSEVPGRPGPVRIASEAVDPVSRGPPLLL